MSDQTETRPSATTYQQVIDGALAAGLALVLLLSFGFVKAPDRVDAPAQVQAETR